MKCRPCTGMDSAGRVALLPALPAIAALLFAGDSVSAADDFLVDFTLDLPEVTLIWESFPGRGYAVWTTTDLTEWSALNLPDLPLLATASPMSMTFVPDAPDVPSRYFRVLESRSPYDPAWETAPPLRTIQFNYNSGRSATQNGADLKSALQALIAGDRLEIGSGAYSINSLTALDLQGTAAAPIRIAAAPGATVVITRPDANQNIINVGVNAPTRFVGFHGLEFTGGSHGIRLYDCSEVWIDQCRVHDTGDVGISANARDTSRLHITRNEIRDTGGTGEGMYLGGNNGSVIMSESVIALNHVHDTVVGVSQGDGIEVKQGSWGNLIAGNLVHDCNYPCILVYGTAGQPVNVVEHNICYGSNDNTMQVQGDCIVRNNLIMAAGGSAFASQFHQGNPTRMTVVHNTIVNTGTAARLSAWESGAATVFANNACYSETGSALNAVSSTTGVTYAGNIGFGAVTSGVTGFQPGSGLGDFVDVTWNATQRDASPATISPLRAAAGAVHAVATDLGHFPREAPHTSGCRR